MSELVDFGSELGKERGKLQRRVRQTRKFAIPSILTLVVGFILSFILPFEMVDPSVVGFFPYRALWFFAPVMIGVFVSGLIGQFATPYRLSQEEELFLAVCSALDDLGIFIEDKREPDRKRAEKKIKNILSQIEEWDIGSVKLCDEVIGPHFEAFKEAFYRKLLGALKQRKEDDLVSAYRILKEFAKYLLNSKPQIKDLDSLSNKMNVAISATIPLEKAGERNALRSIKEMRHFRHIIAVALSLAMGYLTGYVGYFVLKVPIEYAYTMSITVALGGIIGYLNYLRK